MMAPLLTALLVAASLSASATTAPPCADEEYVCEGGELRYPNPHKGCAFDPPCPGGEAMGGAAVEAAPYPCADEEYVCEDGELRFRNPDRGCAFDPPCPGGEVMVEAAGSHCNSDVRECRRDGTGEVDGYVYRDPDRGCEFFSCDTSPPVGHGEEDGLVFVAACSGEVRTCPDGTTVEPDPFHGCAFTPCPGDECRDVEVVTCPNGVVMRPDPDNGCLVAPCHEADAADESCEGIEPVTCPDGDEMMPDPDNDCKIAPCPEVAAADETCEGIQPITCPDGDVMRPDPHNDCYIPDCPSAPHVPCSTLDGREKNICQKYCIEYDCESVLSEKKDKGRMLRVLKSREDICEKLADYFHKRTKETLDCGTV